MQQKTALSARTRRTCALRLALGLLTCTMVSILIIEMGKGYVGRLRPSFARTCLRPREPPYYAVGGGGATDGVRGVYVGDAACSGTDAAALVDGRRSFPSGHAALAASGVAYGQLAFGRYARGVRNGVAGALAMGSGWMWALFGCWVAASRVYDNAHHAGDVAVGALVGLWCAAVQFWYVVGRNDAESMAEEAAGGESLTCGDRTATEARAENSSKTG